MKQFIFGLLFAFSGFGASFTVTATTTPTQAILSYSHSGTCSITLTPSPNATNGTLFTGANTDVNALVNGSAKQWTIGERTTAQGSDYNYYSLALQAATAYSGLITCGSDTGAVAFSTTIPQLGNSSVDPVPFVSGPWGNQGWPTMNWSAQNQYIDPLTGLIVERISGPGQSGGSTYSWTYTSAVDRASAWTTPNNIYASSGYASTAAKGPTNGIFLPGAPNNSYGISGSHLTVDDIQAYFGSAYTSTSGDTVGVCLTRNHGQSCIGSTVTLTLPVGSGSSATVTGPGNYPTPQFNGWGSPQLSPDDYLNPTGTVNTTGVNVTLVSMTTGTYFPLSTVAGDHITIAGTDYTIATFVDTSHLTLTASAGTQTGASFAMNNFGLLVWNSGSSGTVYLRGAVFHDAFSNIFSIGYDGTYNPCSLTTVTVSYAADGVTPITPVAGRTCQFTDWYGNPALYLFIPSTGETRLLAYGTGAMGYSTIGTFDPSDPNTVYYAQNDSANPNVYKCVYNASAGHYATQGPNYTGSTGANYSCTSITSGSGNDILSQIGRVVSGFNASYFGNVFGVSSIAGNYIGITVNAGNQDSLAYSCFFDVTQSAGSQITACHDSWSTYPMRWGGAHGPFNAQTSNGWGRIFLTGLDYQNETGIGLYQLNATSISGETGTTALTNNIATDPTTQNCSTLGVTDPRWIALGATGNNCIQMVVATEPQNVAPSSADKAQWPSSCNPSYAQLQTIQPGDYVYDNASGNAYGENFLVALKTGSGCSPITLVLARNVNQACSGGVQSHSNGWVPVMAATENCNGNNYWFNVSSPSTAYVDNSADYLGHSFTGPANSNPSNLVNYSVYVPQFGYNSYGVRQGTLPSFIGTSFSYGLLMAYPFNGSTAGVNVGYIQTHPGGQSYLASPTTIGYDYRPLGGAGGGINTLWYHTYTLVSGQTYTYKISCPMSSPSGPCIDGTDIKNEPLSGWGGHFVTHDISGPASAISDATPYTHCIALVSGECTAGSSAGDRFISIPNADVSSGQCIVGSLDQNTPCLGTLDAEVGNAVQFNWSQSDPNGIYWRRLGYGFGGPGQTDNFVNTHGIIDGTWAFTEMDWKDGVRSDIIAYQLPPMPTSGTTQTAGYISVLVTVTGCPGCTARIGFGYQENGPVTSLYGTTRQEATYTTTAATPSNPFVFASETQGKASCNPTCVISVPGIADRVLYYQSFVTSGGTETPGQLMSIALGSTPVVVATGSATPAGNISPVGNIKH